MRPVGHQWGLPCWCVSRRARGIQHVFVLILESRSGAHVLGLSSIAGIDAASGFGTEFYGTTERDAHANNLFLFVVPRSHLALSTPAERPGISDRFNTTTTRTDAARYVSEVQSKVRAARIDWSRNPGARLIAHLLFLATGTR